MERRIPTLDEYITEAKKWFDPWAFTEKNSKEELLQMFVNVDNAYAKWNKDSVYPRSEYKDAMEEITTILKKRYNMKEEDVHDEAAKLEVTNEGLIFTGKREAPGFGSKHRDAVPKNIPDLVAALVPDETFEDEKGNIYKILTNDGKNIIFVLLDAKGKETSEKRKFEAESLASMFINRKFFFTPQTKRV